jgi:hypothetical protein
VSQARTTLALTVVLVLLLRSPSTGLGSDNRRTRPWPNTQPDTAMDFAWLGPVAGELAYDHRFPRKHFPCRPRSTTKPARIPLQHGAWDEMSVHDFAARRPDRAEGPAVRLAQGFSLGDRATAMIDRPNGPAVRLTGDHSSFITVRHETNRWPVGPRLVARFPTYPGKNPGLACPFGAKTPPPCQRCDLKPTLRDPFVPRSCTVV